MRLRWLGLTPFAPALVVACVGDSPVVTNRLDSSIPTDAPVLGESGADVAMLPDAGWSPAALDSTNQLALWLDAAHVTTSSGMVGVWPDQSKNHNDAANAQGGPVVDPAAIDNRDAVHFKNNSLKIKDATTLQFGNGQFYIATVVKVNSTPAYFFSKPKTMSGSGGVVYQSGLEFFATTSTIKDDAGQPLQSRSASGHIDALGGNLIAWGDPIFNDAKFHYVALRRLNASTLQLEVDDQAPRTANTGGFDVSQPMVDVQIGLVTYGTVAVSVDFDMAELVVIHGTSNVVADNDAANLHAYLKKKYAL